MQNSNGYEVKIGTTSKELTARERVQLKDTTDCIALDEATKNGNKIEINVDWYAVLDVHNEKSDNKDYNVYIIVDKDGTRYSTGSVNFFNSFQNIVDEMIDAGEEDFSVKVYARDSKNYTGKQFITCSLI